ncbi:hypothetical protein SAMN02910415_02066, partial [Basfia succiniciproducens]
MLSLSKYAKNIDLPRSRGRCHAVTEGQGIPPSALQAPPPTLRGREWSEMVLALSKYGNNFAPPR